MSRRAYFHFYPREFFADTARLTDAEIVGYLRLLSDQFYHASALPLDMQMLMQIAGFADASAFEKTWQKYIELGFFTQTNEGYINKKMQENIQQMIDISNKRRDAATKRWDTKADAKADANADANADASGYAPITNNQEHSKKKNTKKKKFTKPTPEEIQVYCDERSNGLSGQAIFDHYEANGWMRGKAKIVDWKACVRTWETKRKENGSGNTEGRRKPEWWKLANSEVMDWASELEVSTYGKSNKELFASLDLAWRAKYEQRH